jgi:hypothetical protein
MPCPPTPSPHPPATHAYRRAGRGGGGLDGRGGRTTVENVQNVRNTRAREGRPSRSGENLPDATIKPQKPNPELVKQANKHAEEPIDFFNEFQLQLPASEPIQSRRILPLKRF